MPASGIEPRPAAWQATTLTVVPQQSVIGGRGKTQSAFISFSIGKGKTTTTTKLGMPKF